MNRQEDVTQPRSRSFAGGHRLNRKSLSINLALLTGGLLLLCLALPSRESIFVPGELSSKHAQILNNTVVSDRCSTCHPTSHSGTATDGGHESWFASAAFMATRALIENDGRQDELCLQCHRTHMPAAAARAPHDLSPEMWRQVRQSSDSTTWQKVSSTGSNSLEMMESRVNDSSRQTSCAMCHIEHHGRGFDLKLISDSRCQACHRRQFESLASGHPEFTNFPPDRPRGLLFSHARHAQEHFGKKNRAFDCVACHRDQDHRGPYGQVTRSVSFEKACASCHDQPIRAAAIEGWAILQLPSIEVSASPEGASMAHWPATARFGFEGEVSPIVRALLMADSQVSEALAQLPASGKIVDISTISGRRAQVTVALALAIERLIRETARDGQMSWTRRLETVSQARLGRPLNESEKQLIAQMSAGLPPDLFRQIAQQWFTDPQVPSDSDSKLTHGRTGAIPATAIATPTRTSAESEPPAGDGDLLIDLASEQAGSESTRYELVPPADNELLLGDDLLLGGQDSTAPLDLAPAQSSVGASTGQPVIRGATHLPSGGWYQDEATLTIRYLPTGHADKIQAAWHQWFHLIEGNDNRVSLQTLSAQIPGGCVQCHQLRSTYANADSDNSWQAWRVPQRSRADKEFTKFDHTPHLTLPAVSDCRYCHQLTQPGQTPSSQQLSGSKFVSLQSVVGPQTHSEFQPIGLHQCAACHRPGGANDGCLQCHNYHVHLSTVTTGTPVMKPLAIDGRSSTWPQ